MMVSMGKNNAILQIVQGHGGVSESIMREDWSHNRFNCEGSRKEQKNGVRKGMEPSNMQKRKNPLMALRIGY